MTNKQRLCKARAEAKFTWIMPSRSQTSVENELLIMHILQKYIIPKILRNLLLNIWAGGKVASRACALRKFFPEKPVNPSLLVLFVCI